MALAFLVAGAVSGYGLDFFQVPGGILLLLAYG